MFRELLYLVGFAHAVMVAILPQQEPCVERVALFDSPDILTEQCCRFLQQRIESVVGAGPREVAKQLLPRVDDAVVVAVQGEETDVAVAAGPRDQLPDAVAVMSNCTPTGTSVNRSASWLFAWSLQAQSKARIRVLSSPTAWATPLGVPMREVLLP
jgi:hypothetical protein